MATRTRRIVRILTGLGAVALTAGAAAQLQRWFTESPGYRVLSRSGELEVRRYGARVIARTRLTGPDEAAKNEGFRLLAGYIFGGNAGGRDIAMTTPVITEPADGQRIAMTTPVETTSHDGDLYMAFTMPREHTLESLPRPSDARVELVEVPGRVLAVLRFRGRPSPTEFRAKQDELLRAVDAAGRNAIGAPFVAQYDPPWVLGFLRRNEVLVEVDEPGHGEPPARER